MKQKTWYIGAPQEGEVPYQNTMEDRPPAETKAQDQSLRAPSRKSPALSFSFSMILWGGGQMYLGAYGTGAIFLTAMFFYYSTLYVAAFCRPSAIRSLSGLDLPPWVLVSGGLAYLFAGLALWLVNAVEAYYRTERLREEPFQGVDNEYLPLFCSFLFPGWGQFTNGQPVKGIFFLFFGLMGTFSILVVALARSVWPVLEGTPAGYSFEICLVGALAFVPLTILLWIVSAYDSFKSSQEIIIEKLRKYPLSIQARRKKFLKKILKNLSPRLSAILCLLLAISVGCQLAPKGYYLGVLERVRGETLSNNMAVISGWLGKVMEVIKG